MLVNIVKIALNLGVFLKISDRIGFDPDAKDADQTNQNHNADNRQGDLLMIQVEIDDDIDKSLKQR